MEFNLEEVKHQLEEYKNLTQKLKEMQTEYVFLLGLTNEDQYLEKVVKTDEKISLIKEKYTKLKEQEQTEQTLHELQQIKLELEKLTQKKEILEKAWDLQTKIRELENIIVNKTSKLATEKRNYDIHSLFNEANNPSELKMFIDIACISIYKVPLLVALITKDPTEIENDFQVSTLPEELKKSVIEYIENKKIEIANNLILSDKALIDLIENTTGKNITHQQRHNERTDTGFNKQYEGQILLGKSSEYALLKNERNWAKATSGGEIKKFIDERGEIRFDRKDSDMLVSNFPNTTSEDLIYRSFKSMPNERKQNLISAILINLRLCYEMFESYYLSDKVEVPVMLNLTNGEKVPYKFEKRNISHILGIPSTHDSKTLAPNLPQATLDLLGLKIGSAWDVLNSILEHEQEIINQCGLNHDSSSNTYYEMLPWEKILLKTNAFIRGDFFKTTSLISPVNPNSFLIRDTDNIRRISITPTTFGQSAINQTLLNPNIPFSEAIKILKAKNSPSDFTFKGMMYDGKKGLWIPKTNVSAIGERIKPYNSGTLKTLEKYRYLISGISNPSEGGFVAGVESLKDEELSKEYSVQEMLTSLTKIAQSFSTNKEIEYNLREYLEQIKQITLDRSSNKIK